MPKVGRLGPLSSQISRSSSIFCYLQLAISERSITALDKEVADRHHNLTVFSPTVPAMGDRNNPGATINPLDLGDGNPRQPACRFDELDIYYVNRSLNLGREDNTFSPPVPESVRISGDYPKTRHTDQFRISSGTNLSIYTTITNPFWRS